MKKEIMSGVKALLAGMLVVPCSRAAARRLLRGMRQNPSESTEPVSSSEEETSKEKITLTIESSQQNVQGNQYAFCEENIAAFEEAHPNITIEVLLDPDEQITSILQTKLAAGQPSDIVVYNKVSAENELDAVNNFVDLSDEPFVDN